MRKEINNILLRNNRHFELFVMVLILFGVAVGALGFSALSEEGISQLSFVQQFLVSQRSSMSFTRIMLGSFAGGTVFLLLPFVMGFWAVSQPVIFATAVFRGLGLGVGVASIYYNMGLPGIPVAAVTIILPALFNVYAMVVAVRESFIMSVTLASAVFSEKNFIGLKDASKIYCVKFLVLEAIIAAGAAVDAMSGVLINNLS